MQDAYIVTYWLYEDKQQAKFSNENDARKFIEILQFLKEHKIIVGKNLADGILFSKILDIKLEKLESLMHIKY